MLAVLMAEKDPFLGKADRERRRLLAWYDRFRRDLPWRQTTDPYPVWISEIMLQQTTVAAVLPYWERFLQAFPTVEALAGAPEDHVLALWSGLGYYRRARNLRAAARKIVDEAGGRFPDSLEDLRKLPGIGRYTAAAIASICFGQAELVVDGNVIRVLTRWWALKGDPKRRPLARRIENWGRRLIDPQRPGDFNQALMELGATICLPRNPQCGFCPWRTTCRGLAQANPERYPETPKRPEPRAVSQAALVIRDRRDRVLLTRIPPNQHNAGLWDFPSVRLSSSSPRKASSSSIKRLFLQEWGWRVEVGKPHGTIKHSITHHRISLEVFEGRVLPSPRPSSTRVWVDGKEDPGLAITGSARKIFRRLFHTHDR